MLLKIHLMARLLLMDGLMKQLPIGDQFMVGLQMEKHVVSRAVDKETTATHLTLSDIDAILMFSYESL